MGEKIYYFFQILLFGFLAVYFIAKPEIILKLFKQENSKSLYIVIRVIGMSVAFINLAINLGKLFN